MRKPGINQINIGRHDKLANIAFITTVRPTLEFSKRQNSRTETKGCSLRPFGITEHDKGGSESVAVRPSARPTGGWQRSGRVADDRLRAAPGPDDRRLRGARPGRPGSRRAGFTESACGGAVAGLGFLSDHGMSTNKSPPVSRQNAFGLAHVIMHTGQTNRSKIINRRLYDPELRRQLPYR